MKKQIFSNKYSQVMKILKLSVLGASIAPITLTVSCTQSYNEVISGEDDLRDAINHRIFGFGEFEGQITEEQAKLIWEKLSAWTGSNYKPKLSFEGFQTHKVSNDTKNGEYVDYIVLLTGIQKKLDNLSSEWRDIDYQWYDDFDNKKQSFVEAWSGVASSKYETKFTSDSFKDVVAVLTFQHDINGETIGKLFKVASFNNRYQISLPVLTISGFNTGSFESSFNDYLKQTWSAHKNDVQWQTEHGSLWNALDQIAKTNNWN